MTIKSVVVCAVVAFGAATAMPVLAADSMKADSMKSDMKADAHTTGVYVKDSLITTKVKAKLAAKHVSSLTKIKVDTDKDGVVWLSGTAPTKDASDLAESITKDTDGVRSVHNNITVQ